MDVELKYCPHCKLDKPLSDFYNQKSTKSGLSSWCKECTKQERKLARQKNPEHFKQRDKDKHQRNKAHRRNHHLVKLYGITQEQYNEMFIKQGGVCAICHKPETAVHPITGLIQNLAVDHNHKTGKVRGLLCDKHNRGLGYFDDNAAELLNAAHYLQNA